MGADVVTPNGALASTSVRVHNGRITEIAPRLTPDSPRDEIVDLSSLAARWLVPGFVDLHCHGGGGFSFLTNNEHEARAAAALHRSHGTTTLVASLLTAPHDQLLAACQTLAPLVADGTIAGIHLEGPWLSHARCGAQDPRWLRDPNLAELADLWETSNGTIVQVTIAPELPGAMALIDAVVGRGAIAAIGHSDASAETTRAAIDRGARLATHLCNGMAPIHHRDGGCALALWSDDRVTVELINDEIHLHPDFLRQIIRSAGVDRVALVTDAIAAAGSGDGNYQLGDRTIVVKNGSAHLAGHPQTLAGSVLTMDAAFRNVVRRGTPITAATHMCATTPARVLQRATSGAIATGRDADLVALDQLCNVVGVWRRGQRVDVSS